MPEDYPAPPIPERTKPVIPDRPAIEHCEEQLRLLREQIGTLEQELFMKRMAVLDWEWELEVFRKSK